MSQKSSLLQSPEYVSQVLTLDTLESRFRKRQPKKMKLAARGEGKDWSVFDVDEPDPAEWNDYGMMAAGFVSEEDAQDYIRNFSEILRRHAARQWAIEQRRRLKPPKPIPPWEVFGIWGNLPQKYLEAHGVLKRHQRRLPRTWHRGGYPNCPRLMSRG